MPTNELNSKAKAYIKIFNGCEMRIENSVTRVTVQHHEACQTVIPSDGIFHLHQTTIIDYFSFIPFLCGLYLS